MTHTICKIGIGTSVILFTYLTISFSRENQIQVSSEGKMTQVNYTIITSVVKGWLSASPIIYFKRIDVPPQLNSKQEVTIKEYAKTSSGRFCGATGSIDNENNVIIS